MDQLIAAHVFLEHNRRGPEKPDPSAEQAFYASFDGGAWQTVARIFGRLRCMFRKPADLTNDCASIATCLNRSSGQAAL